ncbi:MAG: hypothetical protein LUG93_04785, partial [Lachnospiraceae bacterium]|nr:hypothetical protein [Lachnospiraceae bacterium]
MEEREKCILEDTENDKIIYDEAPFVIINSANGDSVISMLCDAIFDCLLSDEDTAHDMEEESENRTENGLAVKAYVDEETVSAGYEIEQDTVNGVEKPVFIMGKDILSSLMRTLPKPFTVVQEPYHIDPGFRDAYYMYFSNQHFQVKRYSRRLSFFKGEYGDDKYFDNGIQTQANLERDFMGSCVINPLSTGSIGKTLLNPEYVLKGMTGSVFMRLSDFTLHILGRTLKVKAFPYRMQDQETMSCAEVTLLNLMDYFSNQYKDYRTVVPSEIIENEQMHSHERVLPVRGITYPVLTKVLADFGFSPRLYNISAIDSFKYSS